MEIPNAATYYLFIYIFLFTADDSSANLVYIVFHE